MCRRIARLTDDKCQVCLALEKMSGSILYENYFTVMSEPDKDALPLPENRYLAADTKESLLKRMESEDYLPVLYEKCNLYRETCYYKIVGWRLYDR